VTLAVGSKIGAFEVVGLLGIGGMGEVLERKYCLAQVRAIPLTGAL